MKKINILFIMLFLVGGIAFSSNVAAQGNLSADEQKIYLDAINFLSDDEQDFLFTQAEKRKVGIVTYLYDKQLKDFGLDTATVRIMKTKAMFVLGDKPELPLYVRRESKFYLSILDLYKQTKNADVNLAAMAFAAKISHEIFHVRNGNGEDEIAAVEHERKIFMGLVQQHKSAIARAGLEQVAANYAASLEADRQVAARD